MTSRNAIAGLAQQKQLRVAGLMSGTSADGIDVAIVDITKQTQHVVAFGMTRYPAAIRNAVLRLCNPAASTVADICHYNFLLGHLFADALIELCRKSKIDIGSIDLIGSHGQTIYHNPSGTRYRKEYIRSTLQIAEPSIIAQKTGITTIADFRPADIAAGGQGAPLVPLADFRLFAHQRLNRALQNIGGIANVSYLPAGSTPEKIIAFDTGPGNMILDGLTTRITNGKQTYDRNGAIAAQGKIQLPLLKTILRHPFFRRRPPKTAGRENFGAAYTQELYQSATAQKIRPEDLLATATAFTAITIANAYRQFLPAIPDHIILCGGGAQNKTLINLLRQELSAAEFFLTSDFGIDSDAKEAVSFAILAWCTLKGIPGNVPAATGAAKPVILGKIVPVL